MDETNTPMSLRLKVLLGALMLVAVFFVSRVLIYFRGEVMTASISSSTGLSGSLGFANSSISGGAGIVPKFSADETDNDYDGIPNDRESQYGTDSNNPDTDGDGFSDGEEVLSGYNPTIKDAKTKDSNEDVTLTGKYLEKLLGGYLAGDLSGSADSATFSKGLDTLSYAVVEDYQMLEKPVIVPEPVVMESASPDQIASYLNRIVQLFNIIPPDEKYFFGVNSEINTPESSRNFAALGFILEKIAQRMNELTVPREFVSWHIQSVKTLINMSRAYSSFGNIQTDPVRAMVYINMFSDTIESFVKIGDELKVFLAKYAIPNAPMIFTRPIRP